MSEAELIVAVTHVPGSTRACRVQGDAATFEQLSQYYEFVSEIVTREEGRIVKCIGDSVLLVFPVNRCEGAVSVLRELQVRASGMWREFDAGCHVQVKLGAGTLACGELGPPGEERFDIVGDALNRLFKAPWNDFVILPEVEALMGDSTRLG